MNKIKKIVVGELEVNCYILSSGNNALIIDPGADAGIIKKYLRENNLSVQFIIHTHGHFDHIGADNEFQVPVYIHEKDKSCLVESDKNLSAFVQGYDLIISSEVLILNDNDKIELADIVLEVISTPGHTKGGICLLWRNKKCIFTGDTLFYESIGRTDFSGASSGELIDSIKKKLFVLDDGIVCYPGHGQETTIGHEKKHNPFLKEK